MPYVVLPPHTFFFASSADIARRSPCVQVHLTEPEEDLVLAQEAGISHCPNSNFSLLSGMCPVRRFLNKGIKVGLGTDVSGGT
jgi:imidazolonepropionase-like amidohydrolase